MAKSQIPNPKSQDDKVEDFVGGDLDPKEEKTLDMILNGVVIFVLGWLGLGVLLSVGGLFHLWG